MALALRYTRLSVVEARPAVQAICVMRFLVGAVLGSKPGHLDLAAILIGAIGWSSATVAIYVFNGVTDRMEDVANRSRRPIASGALPVRFATMAAAVTALLGLAYAAVIGPREVVVVAVYLAVGYAYSGPPLAMKRSLFTSVPNVAALGLATYIAGGLVSGGRSGPAVVIFAVANAAWMGMVGGIAKDLSDVPGDRAAGRRSWPILLGYDRARIALAAVACAVAGALTVFSALIVPELRWCAVTMLAGAIGIAITCTRAGENADRASRRLPYRAFMWSQHATHLILLATVGLVGFAG